MGVGDALQDVFGGESNYEAFLPPTLGAPQGRNESPEAYRQRLYNTYAGQNQGYQNAINSAMGGNTLNFGQANATAKMQGALGKNLNSMMGQNINFGTQGSMAQQQGLIDQILAQGRGEGPNPALDQLRMTTDQNAKSAAAMAASQRGINPALAARLASQGAANANQQATGQAALQSAQQQLGAQQLGGSLLGQQIGQLTQQGGLNAQNKQGYAQLLANHLAGQRGMDIQQATNQGNAGLQAEALRRQAQLSYQQMINNAFNSMNGINAGTAAQNAANAGGYGMAAMQGVGNMMASGAGMFNKGGEVPNYESGGVVAPQYNIGVQAETSNPMAFFQQQNANAMNTIERDGDALAKSLAKSFKPPMPPIGGDGGTAMAGGLMDIAPAAMMMVSEGGKVDGKAKVKGDSIENDTVPAMLSPGEVVIPRTAMQSPEDAHAFLDKIISKNQGASYKEVLKAKQHYHNLAHGGEMTKCKYCGGM